MEDTFYIEWLDPSDNTLKYACLSKQTGLYWSEDITDNGIIDGSFLLVEGKPEDTIKQLAEQYKLQKGRQFNRRYCIKHPFLYAYFKVEKKSTGERDSEGTLKREYRATWSHKFKSVSVISSLTGRPQGNPSFQDKSYVKKTTEKAKASRKKRLENIEAASKRLNFNPAEELVAWATGDETRLRTGQPITNAQRMKALEILAGYVWAKPKPVDPNLFKQSTGPQVHLILPKDGSEVEGSAIEHKDEEDLSQYLSKASSGVFSDLDRETSASLEGVFLELPEED